MLIGDSGFLKVGQLPTENVEDFLMILKIIGIPVKATKPRHREDKDNKSSRTESEEYDDEWEDSELFNGGQTPCG